MKRTMRKRPSAAAASAAASAMGKRRLVTMTAKERSEVARLGGLARQKQRRAMTTVDAGRRRWLGTTAEERKAAASAAATARWEQYRSNPLAKRPSNALPRAEYQAWWNMIRRCENARQASRDWRRYQSRGIRVCARWRNSFEAFLADMGRKPGTEYSLDRKDNDGNYEPGNCRWATRKQQAATATKSPGRPRKRPPKISVDNLRAVV